jgi:hypothetical protein
VLLARPAASPVRPRFVLNEDMTGISDTAAAIATSYITTAKVAAGVVDGDYEPASPGQLSTNASVSRQIHYHPASADTASAAANLNTPRRHSGLACRLPADGHERSRSDATASHHAVGGPHSLLEG